MSKNVLKWLLCDILVAVIITAVCVLIRDAVSAYTANDLLCKAVHILFTVAYIIADLIILLWFLLYWWSDVTWKNIKRRFKKN